MKMFFRILWNLFLSVLIFLVSIFISVLIVDSLYVDNRPLAPDEGNVLFGICLIISLCISIRFLIKRLTAPRLRTNRKHAIPAGKTAAGYAQSLLNDVNWHADEINKSCTVFDFYYSYEKMLLAIDDLIWLNKKKRIKMTPPPDKELKKILNNLANTINDFLDRATAYMPPRGELRADAIDTLLTDIEENEEFYALFLPENQKRLEELRSEAETIREEISLQQQAEVEAHRKAELIKQLGFQKNIDVSNLDAFLIADSLEEKLKMRYQYVLLNGCSADLAWQLFIDFKENCESSYLPLAAEIRLEDLLREYESKFRETNHLQAIDNMGGHEFEHWCAALLLKTGFQKAEVTQASGDDGVDIIAEKDGIRYAIQCKCYSSDLGNKPVQEVHTGKSVYHCHVGAVMTNRYFTAGGKRAAEATGTLLWDRDWIINALKQTSEE